MSHPIGNLIDVWDVQTFDEGLITELHANVDLVRNFIEADRKLFLESQASHVGMLHASNPYAQRYLQFLDDLSCKMETRTIRAWHYTRLTDLEEQTIRASGIWLSTPETTRQRLKAQVAAGHLSTEIAEALFAESPFNNSEQAKARSDRFWMVSHPVEIADGGVTLLLDNWGGEAVYFWLTDPDLRKVVAAIGKPRVLELAVPLSASRQAYSAGKAVVAAFARVLGCKPDFGKFDLCVTRPLGPETVLAVHCAGEAAFTCIGNGYPTSFQRLEK